MIYLLVFLSQKAMKLLEDKGHIIFTDIGLAKNVHSDVLADLWKNTNELFGQPNRIEEKNLEKIEPEKTEN